MNIVTKTLASHYAGGTYVHLLELRDNAGGNSRQCATHLAGYLVRLQKHKEKPHYQFIPASLPDTAHKLFHQIKSTMPLELLRT